MRSKSEDLALRISFHDEILPRRNPSTTETKAFFYDGISRTPNSGSCEPGFSQAWPVRQPHRSRRQHAPLPHPQAHLAATGSPAPNAFQSFVCTVEKIRYGEETAGFFPVFFPSEVKSDTLSPATIELRRGYLLTTNAPSGPWSHLTPTPVPVPPAPADGGAGGAADDAVWRFCPAGSCSPSSCTQTFKR